MCRPGALLLLLLAHAGWGVQGQQCVKMGPWPGPPANGAVAGGGGSWDVREKTQSGLVDGTLELAGAQKSNVKVDVGYVSRGRADRTITVVGASGATCGLLTVSTQSIVRMGIANKDGSKDLVKKVRGDISAPVELAVDWAKKTGEWLVGSTSIPLEAQFFTGCGDGIKSVTFVSKHPDTTFQNIELTCPPMPPAISCTGDDALRQPRPFDNLNGDKQYRTIIVKDGPANTEVGKWNVHLRRVEGGNNAAVPAADGAAGKDKASELVLAHGVEVKVLYIGVSKNGLDGNVLPDAKVSVVLEDGSGTVCATITGEGKQWGVTGTGSAPLSYTHGKDLEVTQANAPKKLRVEVRMEWGSAATQWALYVSGARRAIAATRVKAQCPNGVQKIKLEGKGVMYDNVQLTCSDNNPVTQEASAWGDPHYTDVYGTKFDFMGVPQTPYVLYNDGAVLVAAVVYHCSPSSTAVTCFRRIRFLSANDAETVDVMPGASGKVEVAKSSWCEAGPVQRWAVVSENAGAVTVTVRDRSADVGMAQFVVTAHAWMGTHHLNVKAKPLRGLPTLGLGGLMFGSGARWEALRAAVRKTGGRAQVPADLVTVADEGACVCGDDGEVADGFCSAWGAGRGARVQQQQAASVVSLPTLQDSEQRCTATGVSLTWARGCCAKLESAYPAEHTQCVRDHCETGNGGGGAECVADVPELLAYVDRTGPVPLHLCAGNVVKGAATLACDQCRDGWYPAPPAAAACTVWCDADTTCGGRGARCTDAGLCLCADGTELRGRCPVAPTVCNSNADCGEGAWCRVAVAAGGGGCEVPERPVCTALRFNGETCTAAWEWGAVEQCRLENCAPGLQCQTTGGQLTAAAVCVSPTPAPPATRCGYVGCFVAQNLLEPAATTSLDACADRCMGFEYEMYAAEGGATCYCAFSEGQLLGLTQAPESECSIPCTGHAGQVCGGQGRVSVYRVCGIIPQ